MAGYLIHIILAVMHSLVTGDLAIAQYFSSGSFACNYHRIGHYPIISKRCRQCSNPRAWLLELI